MLFTAKFIVAQPIIYPGLVNIWLVSTKPNKYTGVASSVTVPNNRTVTKSNKL